MPRRTYYDFILHTEIDQWNPYPGKKIFKVQVFDSPAGQQPEFSPPVEIDNYNQLEKQIDKLENRQLDGDLAKQKALGTSLADLLLPESARDFFYRSLERLKRASDGLRIWLRLTPQLTDLPWEFLYLPHTKEYAGGFLALDPRLSIVRHEELPIPADWPKTRSNLRIVLAMASPKPYQPLASLPREQKLIRDKLNKIQGLSIKPLPRYTHSNYLDGIPGATLDDLQEALKTHTDILHFSGHGRFEARSGNELGTEQGKGSIFLANSDNQAVEVTADQLASLVENKGVRLLSLAACDTGKRLPYLDGEGFTYELLKHKIPCVLAMQFSVEDTIAAIFSATFYQALVAGWTVDEAVSQGRVCMYESGHEGKFSIRDWGAPVLYSRVPGGELFRPVLDEQARQEAERMAEQRTRLTQAWWGWNGQDDTLATTGQLRNLAEAASKIEFSPFQFLFLLRSATKEWIPATPWLDRLRQGSQEARKWLERLDDPHDKLEDMPDVRFILGIDDLPIETRSGEVGGISLSAVLQNDLLTRQTAALALVGLGPTEGLKRLSGALHKLKDVSMRRQTGVRTWQQSLMGLWELINVPLRRWNHQSELFGTLAELDPGHTIEYISSLPPTGRIGIWLWRFRRQFVNDLWHIVSLTLGAGLIAGALMGLLRGLYSIAGGVRVGAYIGMSFFYTMVLCATMAFGMSLAEPLLMRQREDKEKPPSFGRVHWLMEHQVAVLTVVLGTLFFGTAHVVIAWANDVLGNPQYPRELMILAGYLVGLGLSLALHGMPKGGLHQSVTSWFLRFITTALFSVVAQITVFATGQDWSAITLTYTGSDISDLFGWWPMASQWITDHARSITLVDAAFVGILLMVGMSLGLVIAERLYNQWLTAVHHMED